MFSETYSGKFYEIHNVINSQIHKDEATQKLFQARMFLHSKDKQVYRKVYDINQLLGEVGGVMKVFISIFGVIFYPISRFQFYFNSVKKLYLARTKDNNLMK